MLFLLFTIFSVMQDGSGWSRCARGLDLSGGPRHELHGPAGVKVVGRQV